MNHIIEQDRAPAKNHIVQFKFFNHISCFICKCCKKDNILLNQSRKTALQSNLHKTSPFAIAMPITVYSTAFTSKRYTALQRKAILVIIYNMFCEPRRINAPLWNSLIHIPTDHVQNSKYGKREKRKKTEAKHPPFPLRSNHKIYASPSKHKQIDSIFDRYGDPIACTVKTQKC